MIDDLPILFYPNAKDLFCALIEMGFLSPKLTYYLRETTPGFTPLGITDIF